MNETTETLTLADFLLARIAEDEAAANYANTGVRWESWNRSWDTEPQRDIAGGGVRLFAVPTLYDEHVARHDPLRVLADCEAKRRIVELHQSWPVLATQQPTFETVESADPSRVAYRASQQVAWLTEQEYRTKFGDEPPTAPMLLALASVYADHPDYQAEWRL